MPVRFAPIACLLAIGCAPPDDPGSIERIRDYVQEYVDAAAFDGVVLIAEGSEIVFEEGFGYADYAADTPMGPSTRFRIASLSKQFTDYMIVRLAQEGALELDSEVSGWLPDLPGADSMTVAQLLNHTSGVPHTNRLAWLDMTKPFALDAIIEQLSAEPLAFAPGTDTSYSNGGYAVLAALIEKESGLSFAEAVRHLIVEAGYKSVRHDDGSAHPLDATRYAPGPGLGERIPAATYVAGNRYGGGSLAADARDVFRFFRDTFQGPDLDPDLHRAVFAMPADGDILVTGRAAGALAQVYYDIEDDLTVVTLSSSTAWPARFNQDIVDFFRGEDLGIEPLNPVPGAIESLSGTYTSPTFGWTISVAPFEDHMTWTQQAGTSAFIPLQSGEAYLPLWDWLCRPDGSDMSCRQRTPSDPGLFAFERTTP